MRIAVFGLGYVGSVTSGCLAHLGHRVTGVDVSSVKVGMVNDGQTPVKEKGLDRLIAGEVKRGRLRATLDAREAVLGAQISLIAVGTPSRPDGSADLSHVLHAAREIGKSLRNARSYHTVALRSTVPPGTTEILLIPTLERSSRKKAGRDFGVAFHPEFLREGSSVEDFFHPSRTVIGTYDPRSAAALVRLWKTVKAPMFVTSLSVAELVKYVDNAFHALKIAFANEVGSLAKGLGADSREVMKIFVADRKLNISPRYLRPGFSFGGPCLPKDLRALGTIGRYLGLELPLLGSVLKSNASHLERAVELVLAAGKRKVGVLGLAFKGGTDDLRESPACLLVKRLLKSGRNVRVYDPSVDLRRLLGANQSFVQRELPQLPKLLCRSAGEVVSFADVVVLAGNHKEFSQALRAAWPGQILIDLFNTPQLPRRPRSEKLC